MSNQLTDLVKNVFTKINGKKFTNIEQIQRVELNELEQCEIFYKDKKKNEYLLYIDCEKVDYSILTYPLHVLATNRICDTVVSRQKSKGGFRFVQDFSTIRSVSGLYIGFLPYLGSYVYTSFQTAKYHKKDGLFVIPS